MNNRKNGKIELLRFVFAIIIMAFHYPGFFELSPTAQIGVEFFYIIMGIFMAQKIVNSPPTVEPISVSTIKYVLAKAKSFYVYFIPAFIIKTIITAISERMSFLSVLDRIVISIPQLLFLNSFGFHPDTYNGAIYVPASWFLSSALIGLLIIYPLAKHNWQRFVNILAPLIVCFSAAYLYLNFGTILVHYNFKNGINVALLRTLMDLSLGCICFEISQKIGNKLSNNKLGKIVECFLYLIVLFSTLAYTPATVEFPMIICLAIAVTITISQTQNRTFFNNTFFYYLGKLSFPLYMIHCLVIQAMLLVWPNIQNRSMFVLFILISLLSSMLSVYIHEKSSTFKLSQKGNQRR